MQKYKSLRIPMKIYERLKEYKEKQGFSSLISALSHLILKGGENGKR